MELYWTEIIVAGAAVGALAGGLAFYFFDNTKKREHQAFLDGLEARGFLHGQNGIEMAHLDNEEAGAVADAVYVAATKGGMHHVEAPSGEAYAYPLADTIAWGFERHADLGH